MSQRKVTIRFKIKLLMHMSKFGLRVLSFSQ